MKKILFILLILFLAFPVSAEYDQTYQNQAVELQFNGSTPVVWTVDDVVNSETGTTLLYTFEKAGNYYISASDGETTTNYTVTVKRALATEQIEKLNEEDYNNLTESITNEDWNQGINTIDNPYTNLIGNAFYLIIYVIPFVIMWRINGSLSTPVILSMIFGCIFIGFVPAQYSKIITLAAYLGFAIALYKLSRDRI